jgi:hypothetical protein
MILLETWTMMMRTMRLSVSGLLLEEHERALFWMIAMTTSRELYT